MSNEQFSDLKRKAEQGDAWAQYGLGVLYHKGQGVPQDSAQAQQWYEQAAAQGNAGTPSHLVVLYDHGEGVGDVWHGTSCSPDRTTRLRGHDSLDHKKVTLAPQ